MKQGVLIFILLYGLVFHIYSQEKYVGGDISDSLRLNASSVVRNHAMIFKEVNDKEGEWSVKRVVTILNEDGAGASHFACYVDQFRSLAQFQGKVYDKQGNLLWKIKKGDLKNSEFSENLASDDKLVYYECPQKNYPFTVEYEWTVKSRKGWLSYPLFCPVEFWNQSLEKANYTLDLPESKPIHIKPVHFSGTFSEKNDRDRVLRQWMLPSSVAFKREVFGPALQELQPLLYIEPESFIYDKYPGLQQTWKSLGLWLNTLLENRSVLTENQKLQVKSLTKDLKSDKEKIKRLYEYLGETTRYVSIQLGIGGFQPIPAQEVGQVGFGDCKALTNYMKAMLESIGIQSIYTAISTTRPRFYIDYPSAQQMNHVILCIPQSKDSLWLECTNPKIPFGYMHCDIAGHDAFLIKPEGGQVVRLPSYSDTVHTQSNFVQVDLQDTPNTKALVRYTSCAVQYEDDLYLLNKTKKELFDAFRKRIDLPQIEVIEASLKEQKNELPTLSGIYSVSGMYGNKVGTRMFVPVNPFKSIPSISGTQSRKHDIIISYGYVDTDTIALRLPQGYELESLPDPIFIQNGFGEFHSKIERNKDTLVFMQRFYLKKGVYSPASQKELIDFLTTAKDAYNRKFVLKRKLFVFK